MDSVFHIAVTGLQAAQAGIATTSHNIANASTPGYSRQEALQAAEPGVFTGSGYFGQGVNVTTVVRHYDSFLNNQVLSANNAVAHYSTLHDQASSIDSLLGDTQTGLTSSLSNLFSAVNAVAAQPADPSSRQSLVSASQSLVSQMQLLSSTIASQNSSIDQQLTSAVASINTLTGQIGTLNDRIVAAQGSGQPPNDLLDQRDALVAQLGKLVGVQTAAQDNGALNIYLSSGQPLVVGNSNYKLAAVPDAFDPSRVALGLQAGSSAVQLRDSDVFGGQVGGLLAARSQVLDPATNALGRISMALGDAFNSQQKLGTDMNGNAGTDMFTVASPWIASASTNSGNAQMSATLSSAGALTTSDYSITYGASGYTVTRMSDNTSQTFASLPATVDGVALTLSSGTPAVGDRFLLRPTRDGAAALSVKISDPSLIAASSPIAASAATGNAGTGAITPGTVNTAGANLTQPVTITFTGPNTFDVTGTGTGNPTGIAYTPGGTISFNGWSVQLTGQPQSGDTFTIGPNNGATGDNRNATALARLQTASIVGNGSSSLYGAYAQLVTDVGTATHGADLASQAQTSLATQNQAAAQSVSGVNLDEEAANLQAYQQAYQASAKVIQIASSLFDSLLAIGNSVSG